MPPKKRVREKWQWEIFPHSSLETSVCFKKSSKSHKGSLCFTVVSFFPRSSTLTKAGTHRVEMDSLVPKERMWNFLGANMRRGFLWVSVQENKVQHTARRLSSYWETLKQECSGGKPQTVRSCASIPVLLHVTWRKRAPERNENSCKHEQEWGQAEQTCLRIEICFELSHDQALAHSCLLLRFLSTGGTKATKKKGKPLWVFFCMWNYFPPLPTQTLHGARACNSAGCFDSSQSESSVIHSSESVQAKQREQCSNWQTCPDNTKGRHRRVAGKIAWSNTSASEPQISLWKHFFPHLKFFEPSGCFS